MTHFLNLAPFSISGMDKWLVMFREWGTKVPLHGPGEEPRCGPGGKHPEAKFKLRFMKCGKAVFHIYRLCSVILLVCFIYFKIVHFGVMSFPANFLLTRMHNAS